MIQFVFINLRFEELTFEVSYVLLEFFLKLEQWLDTLKTRDTAKTHFYSQSGLKMAKGTGTGNDASRSYIFTSFRRINFQTQTAQHQSMIARWKTRTFNLENTFRVDD